MRFSVLAFLFCSFSVANAQLITLQKQVECGPIEIVVKSLQQKFGEKPIWISQDEQKLTTYMLTENANTNSWTLVQMSSNLACVLGAGTGVNQLQKLLHKV